MDRPAFAPELVARQLSAMARWDKDSNLQDVLAREDLCAHAPETARVLARRLKEGRTAARPASLPYPKDDGRPRDTTALDPIDDLHFSLLASAAAPYVNRTLPGPLVVISTRFQQQGPGVFAAEDWRHAAKRKGRVVVRDSFRGVGGFDVANHYGTTRLESIERLLHSCAVPSSTVQPILELLRTLGDWPHSAPGLPIGPMGSALLGTLALLPVDRMLRDHGIDHERWMDDITVPATSRRELDSIGDEINGQLLLLDQCLNGDKTWFKEPLDVTDSLIEFDLDDLRPSWDTSLEGLRHVVRIRDRKGCRYVLGGLRARQRADAVEFVAESDELWELAPRHAGNYLVSVASSLNSDDVERVVNRCTREPTAQTAAGIAHASRALGAIRVPAQHGSRLHDAADRLVVTPMRTLSPGLYRAGAVSKERSGIRHDRSLDACATVSDLNAQRGLISGLRVDTPAKSIASALTAVVRRNPDLEPTVAWIRHHQKL